MKKTFFKSILCASLFVGALTSCNEVEDLYNPELVREKAKQALGLDVAADQDWNMTSVITANFTLTEDALTDYSFRIYSANPISNTDAVVLANVPVKTDANGKASASFKFEMPSYLEYVYVARVDNHGRRWMGINNVKSGVISRDFGGSSATRGVTDYELPTMENPYTESDITNLLASAYDVANGLTPEGYKSLLPTQGTSIGKITGYYNQAIGMDVVYGYTDENGQSQQMPEPGKFKLIIANGATWEVPGTFQVSAVDIIVAKGGTLKFSDRINMAMGSRIIVMEGGTIDTGASEGAYIYADHYSNMIYNDGTIECDNIEACNAATLYNSETGVIKAKMIKFSGGNVNGEELDRVINWGKIEANEITSNGNQGTLYNGCLIRTDYLKVQKLCLRQNSALEVADIHCNEFYLRENSIVRAENSITTNTNIAIDYVGIEGGKALISTNIFEFNGNYPRYIDTEVYLEIDNIYSYGSYDSYFAAGYHDEYNNQNGFLDIYTVFPTGEAPIVIIAESSNDIANAECIGEGNTPNDYVPEVTEVSTYIYAFEDMSIDGGDYDMNDVVLKCTKLENNQISIELLAAGATKKVYAFFRDTRTNTTQNLFGEVHEALLGYANNEIINTGVDINEVSTKEVIIDVAEGFLFSEHGDIYISDNQNRQAHIPAFTEGFQSGDAPYAICVPTSWKYPKEWVNIMIAYPDFRLWAEGDDSYANWYTNPISSKIY